jgi:hypothetical protein
MSVSKQSNQSNFIVEQAIIDGQRLAEEDEAEEIILKFTDEESKMIKQLVAALSLSVRSLLDSAIGYIYFQRKNEDFIIDLEKYSQEIEKQFQGNNKKSDNFSMSRQSSETKFVLTVEVLHKLEALKMKDKIYECVVIGINLLYKQLIDSEKIIAN